MPTAGSKPGKTPWKSTAFMIEALVLLFVLVASLAVFTTLFAQSATNAHQAKRISEASVVAQNAAEEFSANPVAVADDTTVGKGATQGTDTYTVHCNVSNEPSTSGTLYTAHITVDDEQGEAYSLDATRFVKGAN
jgi:Tfp pilus assembly protein PilV